MHPLTDISGGDIGSGLPAGYRGRTQNRLPTENNLATTMGEAYGRSDATPRHRLLGSEIDMTIPRILVLLTCFLMMMGVLGCGDSEAERKTQALNEARNWTETSTEPVIAEIVTLATDRVPGASLFSDLIADQIAQLLSWDYSEPVKTTGDIYEVIATVSTQVTLELPLLGSKTYGASLPYDLRVDVSTGSVVSWSADITGASVGEVEPAS